MLSRISEGFHYDRRRNADAIPLFAPFAERFSTRSVRRIGHAPIAKRCAERALVFVSAHVRTSENGYETQGAARLERIGA
jgi:hypothetical protein